MARRKVQDKVPEDRETSILRMVHAVDRPRRSRSRSLYVTPRRRVLLWSLGIGTVVTGAGSAIAVLIAESADSDRNHGLVPVRPGPPTVAEAGRLAGPARTPTWTATTGDDLQWIAAAGDRVLACGKALTAYDGPTGRVLWKSTDAAMPYLYNTPPLVAGAMVYGIGDTGGVIAVSVSDGSVAWQADAPSEHWYAWGIVGASDRFLVASGVVDAGIAAPVGAAASAAGTGPSTAAGISAGSSVSPSVSRTDPESLVTMVWVLDVETRRTLWAAPVGGSSDPAIAFCPEAGVVVLYDEKSGVLTGYDVQQGAVRWRLSDPAWSADDTPYATSMTAYEDTVYLAAANVLAVDAGKGTLLWKAEASEGQYHAVAVIPAAESRTQGSDIVVAAATGALDPGTLSAWHTATGEQIWSEAGDDDDFGLGRLFAVDGGTVYYPERYTGSLFAVDAASGATRWTFHDGTATTDMEIDVTAANGRAYLHYGTKLQAFA